MVLLCSSVIKMHRLGYCKPNNKLWMQQQKILLLRNYCTQFLQFPDPEIFPSKHAGHMVKSNVALLIPEEFSSGWSRFWSLQTHLHCFESPPWSARIAGLFTSSRFFSTLEPRQYTAQLPQPKFKSSTYFLRITAQWFNRDLKSSAFPLSWLSIVIPIPHCMEEVHDAENQNYFDICDKVCDKAGTSVSQGISVNLPSNTSFPPGIANKH